MKRVAVLSDFKVILRLLELLARQPWKERLDVVLTGVEECLATAVMIAGPFALKVLVDNVNTPGCSPVAIGFWVIVFVGSWSLGGLAASLRLVRSTRIVERLTRDLAEGVLRSQLESVVRSRSADGLRMGGLLERLPFNLSLVFDSLLLRGATFAVQMAASLAVVEVMVPAQFAIIMALTFAGYLLVSQYGAGPFALSVSASNKAVSVASTSLQDAIRNAPRVVLNGTLKRELRRLADQWAVRATLGERSTRLTVKVSLLQFMVLGLGLATLLISASLEVQSRRLTLSEFILLQGYVFRLMLPLTGLGASLRLANVALSQLRDVLALIRPPAPNLGETVPAACGSILVEGVSFFYGDGLAGLYGLDARLPSKRTTIIVGANGSGKSTLAQILAGILEPNEGCVRLGGLDFNRIPFEERFRHVHYVPQSIGLFNRSLRENALYPPSRQTEQDLLDLFRQWSFLDDGEMIDLDGLVGDGGERLSGGQRQKLELARIVGVEAPVIILDETTASLDPRSEQKIIASLRSRAPDKTLILISHRLSLMRNADHVLFLQKGRLAAAGRHEDLLHKVAAYRAFWGKARGAPSN